MTAKKLVDEIQKHVARHPESADWPVVVDNTCIEGVYGTTRIDRVAIDLSRGACRFILDGTDLNEEKT